jgi:cytochrome c556
MTERIDPYDLSSVGRFMERDRARREAQRKEAHAEVERRMRRVGEMFDGVNPYDLSQMHYIFEPLNRFYHGH